MLTSNIIFDVWKQTQNSGAGFEYISKDPMGTLAAKSLNKKQTPQLGFGCTLCNGIDCDTGDFGSTD